MFSSVSVANSCRAVAVYVLELLQPSSDKLLRKETLAIERPVDKTKRYLKISHIHVSNCLYVSISALTNKVTVCFKVIWMFLAKILNALFNVPINSLPQSHYLNRKLGIP